MASEDGVTVLCSASRGRQRHQRWHGNRVTTTNSYRLYYFNICVSFRQLSKQYLALCHLISTQYSCPHRSSFDRHEVMGGAGA